MIWLLNWLWLGSLLTAAVAAGLADTRRLNAATRERVLWLTLAAVLAIPCAVLLPDGSASGVLLSVALSTAASAGASVASTSPPIELPEALPAWIALVWLFWLAWSVVVLVRLAHAVLKLRRIRHNVSPFPAARERQLTRWTSLDDTRPKPRLVVSSDVHHAAVIGGRRPLIAISPASLATLTDDELDQVVVHEHAHVRRRDDIAVVVQRVVWAVAGFHPAVWWLDRALTLEREVACDDWVLAHATAAKAYGACLVKLAEARSPARWLPVPGAAMSRSELSRRVMRLLDPLRNRTIRRSRSALGIAAAAICCGTVAGLQFPLVGQLRASSVLEFVALPPASRGEPSPPVVIAASAEELAGGDHSGAYEGERPEVIAGARGTAVSTSGGVNVEALVLDQPSPFESASTLPIPQDPVPLAGLETLPAVAVPQFNPDPLAGTESPAANGRSPWTRMADAGMAIGDGARDAGVRTGGFFSRLGRTAGQIW